MRVFRGCSLLDDGCGTGSSCHREGGLWMAGLLAVLIAYSAGAAADGNPWGTVMDPNRETPQAIGSYDLGCLAGAQALPERGPGYLAIRLFRRRFFGSPRLLDFISSLGREAERQGWGTLLIGDLSQPRGGPPVSGHRSHQTGLDVDIWYQTLDSYIRSGWRMEDLAKRDPYVVLDRSRTAPDPQRWTRAHGALLKAAAQQPEVDRIFVHPAIKQALCESSREDSTWLRKLRPWWGHDDHMHVRLGCPKEDRLCTGQPALPSGDGCGSALAWWFTEEAKAPKPQIAAAPRPLPAHCDQVLHQER